MALERQRFTWQLPVVGIGQGLRRSQLCCPPWGPNAVVSLEVLGAGSGGANAVADLGGSSKYSYEKFGSRSRERLYVNKSNMVIQS